MNLKNINFRKALVLEVLTLVIILGLQIVSFGQTDDQAKPDNYVKVSTEKTKSKAVAKPLITDYKKITLGMTAKEVKQKLGKAKVEDKDGLFYMFSKEEQAQIGLDANKKVRVISIIYSDKNGDAPKYKDVFGTDPDAAKQKNGSIYKLVRYPALGLWVAYNRLTGDNPMVTITIQKMRIRK